MIAIAAWAYKDSGRSAETVDGLGNAAAIPAPERKLAHPWEFRLSYKHQKVSPALRLPVLKA